MNISIVCIIKTTLPQTNKNICTKQFISLKYSYSRIKSTIITKQYNRSKHSNLIYCDIQIYIVNSKVTGCYATKETR